MQEGPAPDELNGKVAAVTGGHSGIGYYITEALVTAGMRVAMLGRREAVLQPAAEAIGEAVLPVVCDIRDPQSVRDAFGRVDEGLGPVSAMINNAAVFPFFKLDLATDDQLRAVVETNLLGVMYCSREAIRRMLDRGSGDIVTVSSEVVRHPWPYLSAYSATKAAVEMLSWGWKEEYRSDGIRVAVLRSGRVEVPREAGGVGSDLDPRVVEDFFAKTTAAGFQHADVPGIDPHTTAASVLHILRQPRDASIDLLELRTSRG